MSFVPTSTSGTDLSNLIIGQMDGQHGEEYLEMAQQIFLQAMIMGEEGLRQTFHALKGDYLKNKHPFITPFSNYHDFLKFIYVHRIKHKVSNFVRRHGTEQDQKLYDHYKRMFPSQGKPKNLGLQRWLMEHPGFCEVAYVPPGKARPAHMIVIRRKDTNRIFEKIAERRVDPDPEKPIGVTDVFGIKIITPTIEDAKFLAYDSQSLYNNLMAYGLVPDQSKERLIREGVDYGEQKPGLDNHYDFGSGQDHLIQIKARSLAGFGRFEIILTDATYFLIDEMQHFEYRRDQENTRKLWTPDQQEQYEGDFARAKPLDALLEPERRRITERERFFPGELQKYITRINREATAALKELERGRI